MKKSSKLIILILAVFLLLSFGIIIWLTYNQTSNQEQERIFSLKETQFDQNRTQERIKQLEDKIKELEEEDVPFPDIRPSVLTDNEIKSVVELWCPGDNYGRGDSFISIGSGTIISPEGLVVTNRHVVSNEDWSIISATPTCYVSVTDDISEKPSIKYLANVVAYSPAQGGKVDFDIAVLKIYDVCDYCQGAPKKLPSEFSHLTIGYSDKLEIGDYVAVAGYPEIGGGTFNLTDGIISGRVGDFVLKTDAKIDSGNSGGAVLNKNHELIGVPTWTVSGLAETIGYIIGIDQIFEWYNNQVINSDKKEVPYEN